MKWIGLLAYPFFMLFTFLTANGQHRTLNALLHFEFDKARTNSSSTPGFQDLYYANLTDVLELALVEDEDKFDELRKNESRRLDLLNELDEDSPWRGFVKAEIKLQWAFINFKYGNEWDAFWDFRSASRAIRKNYSKFPEFTPNQKTIGLLNVIFGTIPSKQQWLTNLFGLKGDVHEGIAQLESIDQKFPDFQFESALMLSMVQAYLLEDFEAGSQRISANRYENSPLSNYIQVLVHLKAHESLKARTLLLDNMNKFPFHDYLLGETYFQAGAYEEAITAYQHYLEALKGTTYLKDTYLKLAISHAFLGQTNLYDSYLDKSRNEGTADSEIDKNAVKILENLEAQNPTALKIRFAIDGGFYTLAEQLIAELDQKTDISQYEKLELTYRKARFHHLKGDISLSLKYYRGVIRQADLISETYYAPNSFLQIGYLMRKENEPDSARMYFQRVLDFKRHPYKNSLDNKARIALKGLDLRDE